jgi:NADPH-dependent curcumin reductase CurA
VEKPLPELQDGQVLVQHRYLSLDPYMRGRMSEGKSYALSDMVVGMGGWQQYAIVDASPRGVLRKVDITHIRPLHTLARSACRASPPGMV